MPTCLRLHAARSARRPGSCDAGPACTAPLQLVKPMVPVAATMAAVA